MTVNALDAKDLSESFGFHCLHYSVSEGCDFFKLPIHNRAGKAGSVWVRTVDATATAGEDYHEFNKELTFSADEDKKEIDIKIIDDESWEPDEDFYVAA
jgi:solute carrier family 8 (sodium/calcium exchanger)